MAKSPPIPILALALALTLGACETRAATDGSAAESSRPHVCGGSANVGCAEGLYCSMKPPASSRRTGTCTPKPQMCPMLYQPVCGVDGKTYPNDCHAAQAGVNIGSNGACKT